MTTLNHSRDSTLPRVRRFLRRPWREKADSLKFHWKSFVSAIPVPFRLSCGAWWLLEQDNLSTPLRNGTFEREELLFVHRFLRPGMTVLDIGAHHGLYTLLASKRVGSSGRIFSFEPSPRERRKLHLHLALNLCLNVKVQSLALGARDATANLFVVQGGETGCNSLRPPIAASEAAPLSVRVTTLDRWLRSQGLTTVDFIKLDVEGAELEVLQGATQLLNRRPRPVILAEVQDVRTAPWGYRAKEILTYLRSAGYAWFPLPISPSLQELDLSPEEFDGNFVACPSESIHLLNALPT